MRLHVPHSRSAAWVLAESGASAILSLASMLVIGRVIGPHEAGVGALAISAFLLLDVAGAALFPDALVQRPILTTRLVRTALTASVLVAMAGALLLAGAAPFLGSVAEQEALPPLLLALAPLLPLSAFAGTGSGLAMRDQRFRFLAMRVLLVQPVALGAGLLAASAGYGAWAMVVAQAVATGAVFLMFLLAGRLPLRPALDVAALRELWPVAGPQIGALFVGLGRYRLFLLALGLIVTEAVLAQAHFAFRMIDAVLMMVWQAVTRLGMPRLCAAQGNRAALAASYGQLAQLQALLGLPAAIGIGLVADDLVHALLGPGWAGTSDAARIAAFAAAATFLHGNQFSLFVALGKARLNFYSALAHAILPLIVLHVMQPGTPAGIAAAWAAPLLVVTPVQAWIVLRELDRPVPWLLRQTAPALAAAAVMAPAVLALQTVLQDVPPLLRATFCALAGGAIFCGVAWLLLGARLPSALHGRHLAPAQAR